MNSVPFPVASSQSHVALYDPSKPADETLFWVVDKGQRITHEVDMATIVKNCRNTGTTMEIVGVVECNAPESLMGQPEEIHIHEGDKLHCIIVRQSEDSRQTWDPDLTRMDTVDMMPLEQSRDWFSYLEL